MENNQDLLHFVYDEQERRNADYKRSIPWNSTTKISLIKHLIGLSNAGGGYLIIGYDEAGEHVDSRRTGVLTEHLQTWDLTEVSRDVNNYSGPPIDIELIKVNDNAESKCYIFVRVPSHEDVPHLCIKDKCDEKGRSVLRRGALYHRNKNKETEEISDPSDFRDLIRRCMLSQRKSLLSDFELILGGHLPRISEGKARHLIPSEYFDLFATRAKSYRPEGSDACVFLEVLCYPKVVPGSFSARVADQALFEACWDYRGWPYIFFLKSSRFPPKYFENKIEAFDNEPFNSIRFDYWCFDFEDVIFYSQNMTTESSMMLSHELNPVGHVKFLAEVAVSQGRLFSELGFDLSTEIALHVRYLPARDLRITLRDGYNRFPGSAISQPYGGDILPSKTEHALSSFLNTPAIVASDLVLDLMARMGVEDKRISGDWLINQANEYLSKGQKVTSFS